MDLRNKSGHEGPKKNLHPSDTRAVQPVAQRLAARATWPTIYIKTITNLPVSHYQSLLLLHNLGLLIRRVPSFEYRN